MTQLVPVDARAIATATGFDIDKPVFGLAGVDGGEIVGIGGLAWGGGRCWLFFTMLSVSPRYVFPARRGAERLLRTARQLGETQVFTTRDDQFDTSSKLLKAIGFSCVAMADGREVWLYVWH